MSFLDNKQALGKAALVAGGIALGAVAAVAAIKLTRPSEDARLTAAKAELAAVEAKLAAAKAELAPAAKPAAAAAAAPAKPAAALAAGAAAVAGGSPTPTKPAPSPAAAAAAPAAGAASSSSAAPAGGHKKPVRIYMDGVFDLMHYGHSNALRQAHAVGDVLVVGLVNDAEVIKNKGTPPVMPEEERYIALSACKWVDEVIRDAPYDLTEEWVTELVTKHNIDFIVHGDDPCITADGKDAYAYAKRIGKYKQIKRTEGVSTTEITGRMLLMSREHHVPEHEHADDHDGGAAAGAAAGSGAAAAAGGDGSSDSAVSDAGSSGASKHLTSGDVIKKTQRGLRSVRSSSLGSLSGAEEEEAAAASATAGKASSSSSSSAAGGAAGGSGSSSSAAVVPSAPAPPAPGLPIVHTKFLPTARRIMQFADGRVPRPEDKVVYMCGAFDLFSAGHIAALQEAKKCGDFLLVGIHDDATVNALRGHGLPILNLYERTLSLLSCKYVDEVIIGAPAAITEEMIKAMNISVVVRGEISDTENAKGHEHMGWGYDGARAAAQLKSVYAVPEAMGILRTVHSPRQLTALDIIDRILSQRAMFTARYERKSKMEDAYVAQKTYIQEA